MSTPVVYNGISFTIPAVGDASWGTNVSNYLIALATGSLTKAGGAFTLTSEVDFGSNFGLKSVYFKSKTVNPSTTGVLRLANADFIAWRNNANSANLALGVNASDQLTFNGVTVPSLALGSANQLLGMNAAGTANEYKTLGTGGNGGVGITNGVGTITLDTPQDIRSTALPTFAGLTLTSFSGVLKASTGTISASLLVNADVSASAAIAYSKLNLSGSIATGDLASGLLVPASKGGTGVVSTATFPAAGVVVTEAAVETLTNKSFTTPVQTSYEDFTDISSPAAPGAGVTRIYSKSGQFYKRTATLPEALLGGGGGGSGSKNYLSASTSTAAGWLSTGTATATTDTTTSDLPEPTVGTGILFSLGTATNYSYARWTLDPSDYNSPRIILKAAIKALSSYASGNAKIEVYSNTASNYGGTSTRLGLTTDVSGVSGLTTAQNYLGFYDNPGSSAPYMELRIVTVTATGTLCMSSISTGPGQAVQGGIATDYATFTPSYSAGFGTVTVSTALVAQTASRMSILSRITAGTPTAAVATLAIPNGLTAASSLPNGHIVGRWYRPLQGSASTRKSGPIFTTGGTKTLNMGNDDYTTAAIALTAIVGTTLIATSDEFEIEVWDLPIAEWAGATVNLGQNAVEYAYNTSTATTGNDLTSFGFGTAGFNIQPITSAGYRRVRFLSPILATDVLSIEILGAAGFWTPLPVQDPDYGVNQHIAQGTVHYGFGIAANNGGGGTPLATDVDLYFGTWGVASGATYAASGSLWSTQVGLKWRVKKTAGGVATGFGAYQAPSAAIPAGASGLIPQGGVPGRTDGNAVPSGAIAEQVKSIVTSGSAVALTTATYVNMTSVTTTSGGRWRFDLQLGANASASPTNLTAAISAFSGNTTTDHVAGDNQLSSLPPTSTSDTSVTITWTLDTSAAATYYGKARGVFASGTAGAYGKLSATRIG